MTQRQRKLVAEIGTFLDQYGRKTRRNFNSNDRVYDRNIEKVIKRMDPAELDELIRGEAKGIELVDS